MKDTLNRANGHYRLGMIREKMGATASARAEYASALKLFPAHEAASNARKKLSRR